MESTNNRHVKLNFDGAVDELNGKSEVGFIVHDHREGIIMCGCVPMDSNSVCLVKCSSLKERASGYTDL